MALRIVAGPKMNKMLMLYLLSVDIEPNQNFFRCPALKLIIVGSAADEIGCLILFGMVRAFKLSFFRTRVLLDELHGGLRRHGPFLQRI